MMNPITRLIHYTFCCICFIHLKEDECAEYDGDKWNICIPCYMDELEMGFYCFNTGALTPWD